MNAPFKTPTMQAHYARFLAQAEVIEAAAIAYANALRRTGGKHGHSALHAELALRIATEELDTADSLRDQLGVDAEGYPLDANGDVRVMVAPR